MNDRTEPCGPRFTALDAILLAPLAAPFIALPLGLMGWGLYGFGTGYVTAIHTPAAQVAWWQWPWDWPGARIVEAFYSMCGALPASEASFSNPLHLFVGLDLIDRAGSASAIDCLIALLPLPIIALMLRALRTAELPRLPWMS